MQTRLVLVDAGVRTGLCMAATLLAATFLLTPVEAQTDEHSLTTEMKGVCCVGPNDHRMITEDECLAEGDEATWIVLRTAEQPVCGACAHETNVTCRYTLERDCDDPKELFCANENCTKCLEKAIPDDDDPSYCMMHRLFRNNGNVLSNMGIYHQFQDQIVVESAKGREMKALFHEHMWELGLVLVRNPDLKERGMALLEIATPGFRSLLDEPGGEELVLTPDLVQEVNQFLADVADHAGPSARSALEQVRAEFDAVEGMSLSQIRANYQ